MNAGPTTYHCNIFTSRRTLFRIRAKSTFGRLSNFRHLGIMLSLLLTAYHAPLFAADADLTFVVSMDAKQGETLSASQIRASQRAEDQVPEVQHGVSLLEEYRSDGTWFHVLQSDSLESVNAYLSDLNIVPKSVFESLFINSPQVAGGPKAGNQLREGHKVYMIERDIPGVGLAPLDELKAISKGSQAIIEGMGDAVEWDHSFLTSEGTFCVYRAGDPAMIEEHARIAGIPADPITEVQQIVRSFEF